MGFINPNFINHPSVWLPIRSHGVLSQACLGTKAAGRHQVQRQAHMGPSLSATEPAPGRRSGEGQCSPRVLSPHRPPSLEPPSPSQREVLTAVRSHLPLLIDQQQDKGEAEDSHDAGARGQGRSRDAWKDKSSRREGPLPSCCLS